MKKPFSIIPPNTNLRVTADFLGGVTLSKIDKTKTLFPRIKESDFSIPPDEWKSLKKVVALYDL